MNLLNNAVAFSPQNVSFLVVAFAAIAWFALLVILLSDVFVSPMRKVWKSIWILLLIGLPFIGSILYGGMSIITFMSSKRS